MEKYYKNIEHTGDIGVEVWGQSREELVGNASKALTDTIVDVEKILPKREVEWTVEGDTPEDMLVHQLQEILFRLDSEGMVFTKFQISMRGLNSYKCLALGEPLDRERHGFKTEIKAITYHRLKISEDNDQWKVQIIFDV